MKSTYLEKPSLSFPWLFHDPRDRGRSPASTQTPVFVELNNAFTRTGTRCPTHGKSLLSDKNVTGIWVESAELSYAEREHPSRPGASLQARSIPPGLCCIMQSLLGKKLAIPFFILQTRESLIKTRSPQQVSAV